MEEESLCPLLDCEEVLHDAVKKTETLLEQGNSLSNPSFNDKNHTTGSNNAILTKDRITAFQKQAALNNW